MLERASRVGRESGANGHEPAHVPVDHGLKEFDNAQLAHARILERAGGRVAKAKAANNDIEAVADQAGEPDARQRDLRGREHARHQELVAELDLKNVDACRRVNAPPEAHVTDGSGGEGELLESLAHAPPTNSSCRHAS